VTPEGRLADRALVLTVATFILLTPPIVAIFDLPVMIFGLPVLHVACFAVWLAAIGLGGWLASRLAALQSDEGRTGRVVSEPANDG
jgi:hypothetical protein